VFSDALVFWRDCDVEKRQEKSMEKSREDGVSTRDEDVN
jgi:hypothetical protein